jgi:glycosyltransferase involved in cell wall biosynthesis
MRIFVLGVPHTKTLSPLTPGSHTTCAFTSKVWNLCKMMYDRGHEVIHLGVPGSEPICTRHVDVVPIEWWEKLYGARKETEYYITKEDGEFAPYMEEYEKNAREALLKYGGEDYTSIVCCTWGGPQRRAAQNVPQLAVESGIGYMHTWSPYRIYESYAWMHWQLGKEQLASGDKWYYSVIPNAFDPSLFGPVVPTSKKQNYFLVMCRLNEDKGVRLACQVAEKLGVPIKIVGQGDPSSYLGAGVTYHKPVGAAERNELMRYAKGFFSATRYIEPFGGVAVEAMLAGCPVITTDWGAYTETVPHGYTGYRCRTWEQFVWAAQNIESIDPYACHNWALSNFSLDRVGKMYEEAFTDILRLKHAGWLTENPDRKELDWLRLEYPKGNM